MTVLPGIGGVPDGARSVPSASYIGLVSSTSTATNRTFASAGIGSAPPNPGDVRTILLVFAASAAGTSAKTVSSVTVGGVSATKVLETSHAPSDWATLSFWVVDVPDFGSVADIVANWSGSQDRCVCAIYSLTNMSKTLIDSASGSAATQSLDVNTVANGFAVGGSFTSNSASISWTGLTSNATAAIDGTERYGFASAATVAATPRTVTATRGATSDARAAGAISLGPGL